MSDTNKSLAEALRLVHENALYCMPPPYSRMAEVAAREAFGPVRELHKPRWENCINACCSGEQCRLRSRVCEHDYDDWPCDTARLVYPVDELT